MVKDLENGSNSVRKSRKEKALRFVKERPAYMRDVVRSINGVVRKASRMSLKPCVRLNGSQDIPWERIRITAAWAITYPELLPHVGKSLPEAFPEIQFVDYAKDHTRFDRVLPANYHLTFSRSETNESKALELLARGVNVAVVFAGKSLPQTWNGFQVVNGDEHDLRHLDPRGTPGFVIGLSPKGQKAKKDQSGFVVRDWQ